MSQLNLALSWYFASVTTLVFCLVLLIYISFAQTVDGSTSVKYQNFRALPALASGIANQEVSTSHSDARSVIVENFFSDYKSPLSEFAQTFITVADRYQLDYRLLPAISMQESNGGKVMPKESFNPFGYGVYGGKVLRFANFEEAIEKVGRGLKADYFDQGLKTPSEIMPKYTPPSNGSWAEGVLTFMEELR